VKTPDGEIARAVEADVGRGELATDKPLLNPVL
jgi:hypothetical protein